MKRFFSFYRYSHNEIDEEYSEGAGEVFVEIVLLIYIFCGFRIICDKFLIPSIEKIQKRYHISERLAGSTLLALGGSVGLYASNMNAVFLNKSDEIQLGLTGILGSAMFQMTIAIGIGCLVIKNNYKLSYFLIARDLIIYLVVVVILFYYLEMNMISATHNIIFLVLWVMYMIYLFLTASGKSQDTQLIQLENTESYDSNASSAEGLENLKHEAVYLSDIKNHSHEFGLDDDAKKLIFMDDKIFKKKKERIILAIENESSIIRFIFYGMLKIFSKPWEILLELIMPKSSKGILLFVQFLIPLFLIWNASELELYLLEKIIKKFNLSANFVGLTLTAWGNNSPDLFNVISAMEKGMVDLAINACIASQIHNIFLGLGLPWLVYNLKFHKALTFTSGGSIYAFTLFFNCIFILFLIIGLKLNKTKFDLKIAIFLFLVYILYLIPLYLIIFVFKKNI